MVLTVGVLFVVALLAGAGGAVWFMRKIGDIDRIDDLNVDAAAAGEPTNYLIVGSDTRATSNGEFGEVGGQRSDTIMIVRLDPETEQASLLSLPRDLIVPIAGHDASEPAKLNSAYAESHQTLVDTIRLNFGIEINHYVVVDFVGFQRMVDAVGGVRMQFDRSVKDDDSGLFVPNPGCVTLNGEQALAYARSRHLQYKLENGRWSGEDPRADLGRIERQQIFVRAALTKVLGEINNPLRLTELIDIGVDSVSLDPESDPFDLAEQFSDFSLDNLETYSLPVVDLVPEVSVTVDTRNAPRVLAIFRGEDPDDVPAGEITVTVLNGTGIDNQANDAAAAFQAVGFQLGERSDYPDAPLQQTTVFHRSDEPMVGLRVMRHITGGAQLQVRDDLEPGHVVVATGADFTTIHMQPTPLDQLPTTTVAGGAGASQTTTSTTPSTSTTAPSTTSTTVSEYALGVPC